MTVPDYGSICVDQYRLSFIDSSQNLSLNRTLNVSDPIQPIYTFDFLVEITSNIDVNIQAVAITNYEESNTSTETLIDILNKMAETLLPTSTSTGEAIAGNSKNPLFESTCTQ